MKKARRSLIAALACALVLVLSLGIVSACGTGESASAGGAWYYGAAVPAGELGQEGDYYLNTKTLASYKKTANGWTAAIDAGEVGSWFYGNGAPDGGTGAVNDFYLDTESGNLYHKDVSGWGEPVLKLFGKDGRDGVLWYSGTQEDPNTYGPEDTTLNGCIAGDFYLDTVNFEVWQLGTDGTWTDLGSLRGESGKVVGWTVGSGAPTAETAVGEGGFYLDSSSGNIYQRSGESEWALKGSLDTLSASHIKNIEYNTRYYGKSKWGKSGTILNPENSLGGSYTTVNGDTSVYGYWFTFENDTHLFIDAGDCRHTNAYDAASNFYLYQDDCERGTAYWHKCKFCGEWSLVTAGPTGSEAHPFNKDVWKSNETHHWHPATCSHDVTSDMEEHKFIKYATFKVDDTDEVKATEYTVWYECSVCGYKYAAPTIDDLKGEDGEYHISSVSEWNAFATKYNANKLNTIALSRASGTDVTVSIDSDIDFNGASLKSLGSETNPFTGTLKGNNNTIRNFTLTGDHAGLLGVTGEATVQDLTITGAAVTATEGGSAGVLAAKATGALTVQNVTVKESEAAKADGASGATVGGLVGKAEEGGSVSVESVEADVAVDGANHNSGQEGNMLVGGSGSAEFTGKNKVGYPVGEDFIEMHYKNGDTTEKIQFEIYSVNGLETFRDSVNGEGAFTAANNYAGKTVVLMDDIDFKGFDENGNAIEKNIWWSCIGVGFIQSPDAGNSSWNGKTFNGTFDGQDHTIKNICMGYDNLSSSPHNGLYPSLFGGLVNATVKNLKFENVEAGKSPRSGYNSFGILAKWQNGGTISGIDMNDVELVGGEFIGLLCGMAHGTISDIKITKATVTGSGRCVGGLVGRGSANFENCTLDDCKMNVRNGYLVGGILGQGRPASNGAGKTMKNVTVKNTHIVCDSSNSNASYDIGLVVGYLYRAASGTDTFETVTVENCSVSGKTESTRLDSFILRNVGGIVGSVGCQFANFSSQGASGGGDINISFKDVTVKDITLSSGGSIEYSAGMIGGRSLFKDGGTNYGNIALTFEGCSVKGLTMETGQQFADDVSITASGYYVGSFDGISFGGRLPPTNESVTVTFTGENTYQPTVEALPALGMDGAAYTVSGELPAERREGD